jgi:hypothetical protein
MTTPARVPVTAIPFDSAPRGWQAAARLAALLWMYDPNADVIEFSDSDLDDWTGTGS